MNKKKRRKSKKKLRRIQICRVVRKIGRANHPVLKPGMILQFRTNPADSLKEDEWIFDPGIRLWDGNVSGQQLHEAFQKSNGFGEEKVKCERGRDIYNSFALLVKIQKLSQGYFFQVLINEKLWWVHQSDFKKAVA